MSDSGIKVHNAEHPTPEDDKTFSEKLKEFVNQTVERVKSSVKHEEYSQQQVLHK